MHDIEIAPIAPEHWPDDARDWTRSTADFRLNERLGSALALTVAGEDWWVDGAAAFKGTCPKGYQKRLRAGRRWLDNPDPAGKEAAEKMVLRLMNEELSDPRRFVPAFTRIKPHHSGRGEQHIDVFVPKGATNLIKWRPFEARYVGFALRRFRGVRFTLGNKGDTLFVRDETGAFVGAIMRMSIPGDERRGGKRKRSVNGAVPEPTEAAQAA